MQNGAVTDLDLRGIAILVLEDTPVLRKQIAASFEQARADVTVAATVEAARAFLRELSFDFAVIDVHLPDGRGTDLLRENVFSPNTGVIVMTADAEISSAVEAMKLGALDFLVKPFDTVQLSLVIERARRGRQAARVEEQQRDTHVLDTFFFGSSLAKLEAQLERILAADLRVKTALAPVLIEGETGTGKTTIARWIHHRGPRAAQPLVEVNCSALPEALAESELFGHERGAFTDARAARMGLFEAAHGGTLFLDELSSLSLPLQAKVLTAIEERQVRRVGGNKLIAVDVRVVAASNRDIKELVAQKQFREDLYHRLDLFRVALPALRERGEDILKLAALFVRRMCQRHRVSLRNVSSAGQARLLAYPWPGNVRELSHEIERAIVFEDSAEFTFERLMPAGSKEQSRTGADWFNESFVLPPDGFSLDEAIERLIRHAMKQADGNVSAAARLLGVSRDFLRYRLKGADSTESARVEPE